MLDKTFLVCYYAVVPKQGRKEVKQSDEYAKADRHYGGKRIFSA